MIYHFTLDVAATPQNSKCERFFTAAEDGLKQSQSDLWQTEDKAAIQFKFTLARAGIARSK